MGQSSDQIRGEIDQKRADAAEKIDQLQNQVQGTADDMRTQVQDTADQVKETAEQIVEGAKATVDETVESIKENMDLRQQIEERPLVALGVALVGGFLLGGMSGNGGGHHHAPSPSMGSNGSTGFVGTNLRSALRQSGLDEMIENAGAAMLGTVTDQLKGVLDRNFPGMADKMQTAQRQPGGFADKAKAAQS
jgi:hypothetical protein